MFEFLKRSPVNYAISKFSHDPIFSSIYFAIVISLILEAIILSLSKSGFNHKLARIIGYSAIIIILVLLNILMLLVRR